MNWLSWPSGSITSIKNLIHSMKFIIGLVFCPLHSSICPEKWELSTLSTKWFKKIWIVTKNPKTTNKNQTKPNKQTNKQTPKQRHICRNLRKLVFQTSYLISQRHVWMQWWSLHSAPSGRQQHAGPAGWPGGMVQQADMELSDCCIRAVSTTHMSNH